MDAESKVMCGFLFLRCSVTVCMSYQLHLLVHKSLSNSTANTTKNVNSFLQLLHQQRNINLMLLRISTFMAAHNFCHYLPCWCFHFFIRSSLLTENLNTSTFKTLSQRKFRFSSVKDTLTEFGLSLYVSFHQLYIQKIDQKYLIYNVWECLKLANIFSYVTLSKCYTNN